MSVFNIQASRALMLLLKWVKLVFTPLALLVIVLFIWKARSDLVSTFAQGDWVLLITAMLLWMGTHALSPLITVLIFRACQIKVPYNQAFYIHCNRLPAKYLPGGIWHSVGRANDYFALGNTPGQLVHYFLLENFLLITVSMGLGSALVHPLVGSGTWHNVLILISLAAVIGILSFPYAFKWVTGRNLLDSKGAYLVAVVTLALYWCVAGMAFACYFFAFKQLGLTESLSEIVGVYIFSWSIGYMAIFAPQGIGVTEYMSGSLLNDNYYAGQILALLVGFRVLVLVSDMVSWLLAGILRSRK